MWAKRLFVGHITGVICLEDGRYVLNIWAKIMGISPKKWVLKVLNNGRK